MFTAWSEGEEGSPDFSFPLLCPKEWPDCTYCVYQLERGKESGRLHYQGYAEFVGQKRFKWIHENCEGLERAAFFVRRGTQQEAIRYASKEETRVEGPWHYGEPKEDNQGKRNDLVRIQKKIEEGVPEHEIAQDHFGSWCRMQKAFTLYRQIKRKEPRRNWRMKILIYVGVSGAGKSRFVDLTYPDAYWKDQSKWWDGYYDHDVVIWDEFYAHCCSYSSLLRLLDSTPYRVEVKGATRPFVAKTIIFTSNQFPDKWYNEEKTHQMVWEENPLFRRIMEFGEVYYSCKKYDGEYHFEKIEAPFREPTDPYLPLMLPDDEINDGLSALASILEPSNGGQDPKINIFEK